MAASLLVNGAHGSHTPDHKFNDLVSHTLEDSQTLVRFQEPHAEFPPEAGAQNSGSHGSDSDPDDLAPEMAESMLSKRSDASSSTIGALARGRSIFRPTTSASAPDVRAAGLDEVTGTNWRQLSGSRTRGAATVRDRPSQSRSRSVVFLSIWAFVSLGGLFKRSNYASPPMHSASVGGLAWKMKVVKDAPSLAYAAAVGVLDEGLPPPPMDYSLLVGRIAAWMCVCFYLTSRMPQICRFTLKKLFPSLSG